MKKIYFLTIILISVMLFLGCKKYFEVDPDILQEKIYDPTKVEYEGLEQNTVLYIDHSTCVIDAVKNTNSVLNHLYRNLSVYSDEIVLIKGSSLDNIQLNATNKTDKISEVWSILTGIRADIPYADIKEAIKNICNSNHQAVLVTDCEYYVNRVISDAPYMSAGFKDWLQKGHSIYIVVEPYKELNRHDKNRFYFFFTDDRMSAPISNLIYTELKNIENNGAFTVFKLTNSDIFVQREGNNMVAEDLDFTVTEKSGFQYVEISDDWNSIREYIMKLDKYGEPLPEEKPIPLIKNLIFNNGENFAVTDVEIVATNITSQYLSKDCDAAANVKLDCKEIKPNVIDMSKGFRIDKNALTNNKLNLFLTEKIFDFLTDEYGGNLIRLDFVVTDYDLKPNFNYEMFTWKMNGIKYECVAKSIKNVLFDVEVVPTSPSRRIIHTVFIKTASYKQ
jgi:hypothetical protein